MIYIHTQAARFHQSFDVTLTIQNNQQTHLKFDNCRSVQVFDVTISSLGDGQNTAGIHLQNSKDVTIYNTKLGCEDDCVSIHARCSGINIQNVDCGPSHGSLGKDDTKACVLEFDGSRASFGYI